MAENNNQGGRTATSTQIRNMYSDGISYLNMKFFNTNMSFQFAPFVSKDATGRSTYDQQKSLMTTANFEAAFAIYKAANDIIQGGEGAKGSLLNVPCAQGASLTLERKIGQNGQMETWFIITKNNASVPFKFNTHQIQVKENEQMVTKVIESGLGALVKTLDGYLTGINADRHLDKLTEDFIKSKEGQPAAGGNSFQTGSGYQPKSWQNNNQGGGGYKKPWQNNNNQGGGGGYKKPWQNNNQQQAQPQQPQQNSWESKAPAQQDMSTYQIQG